MNETKITLTQEQKDSLSKITAATAQTLCDVLGIRFVIENGKVEGLEL